jgi:hypothetical protein
MSLLVLRCPGGDLPLGIKGQTAPFEEDAVVAADLVDVHQGNGVGAGGFAQQLPPQTALADVKRGCRDVDQQVGPVGDHQGDGVDGIGLATDNLRIVPAVFADGDAQAVALVVDGAAVAAGFEIAAFVKNIVGGQKPLVNLGDDFPVLEQNGGVEQGFPAGHGVGDYRADQHADAGYPGQEPFEADAVGLDEIGSVQEVSRRVAADTQLREHDQLASQPNRFPGPGNDAFGVGSKISDDWVDLGQCDSHCRSSGAAVADNWVGRFPEKMRELGQPDGRTAKRAPCGDRHAAETNGWGATGFPPQAVANGCFPPRQRGPPRQHPSL